MARLYSNENVPMPTVDALRLMGHDVLTAVEAGLATVVIQTWMHWPLLSQTSGSS